VLKHPLQYYSVKPYPHWRL